MRMPAITSPPGLSNNTTTRPVGVSGFGVDVAMARNSSTSETIIWSENLDDPHGTFQSRNFVAGEVCVLVVRGAAWNAFP
jgi:hypothetical protein